MLEAEPFPLFKSETAPSAGQVENGILGVPMWFGQDASACGRTEAVAKIVKERGLLKSNTFKWGSNSPMNEWTVRETGGCGPVSVWGRLKFASNFRRLLPPDAREPAVL